MYPPDDIALAIWRHRPQGNVDCGDKSEVAFVTDLLLTQAQGGSTVIRPKENFEWWGRYALASTRTALPSLSNSTASSGV